MNNRHLLQTMFALCTAALFTTSCTNDVLLSPEEGNDGKDTSVSFTLGLPGSDEVHYTRADVVPPLQDATEWAIKTLKVYHFSTTKTTDMTDADYTLAKAYDVPVKEGVVESTIPAGSGTCVNYGDGNYSLRLSLRSNLAGATYRHRFVVVANDVCSAFDQKVAAEAGTDVPLTDLKMCIADKQLIDATNSADLFMGSTNGLCMTGETGDLTLNVGNNAASGDLDKSYTIELTRIMARLDVESFVATSQVFELKSVSLKYGSNSFATKGYLFNVENTLTNDIWRGNGTETMEVTHNSQYDAIGFLDYDSYTTKDESWVSQVSRKFTLEDGKTITRTGTWYKKVLYMYPYPKTIGNEALATPDLVINYTLNGVNAICCPIHCCFGFFTNHTDTWKYL